MLAAHTIMSQSAHPGRAAPNTALCFVLSGLALWWGSRPRRPGKTMAAIGVLGAVVLSMGTAAVLGYLARCPTYAWGPWSQMAANTGFGFIALGLGIVIMPSSCSNRDSRATVGWPAVATVCAGLTITLSFAYGLDREMQSHSTHVFGLGLQLARDSPASAILGQREGQMILLTAATITGIVCSVLSGFLVHLTTISRRRAEALEEANRKIEKEIRERSGAEEKLLESEGRFRSAFEQAPHGMCLSGADGGLLPVNRAFCEMAGRSEEELLGAGWSAVTHPEDLGVSHAAVLRLLSGEVSCLEFEKRYIGGRGNVISARVKTETENVLTALGRSPARGRSQEGRRGNGLTRTNEPALRNTVRRTGSSGNVWICWG